MVLNSNFKIKITPNAEDQLDRILKTLENLYGEKVAMKLALDLKEVIDHLKIFPELYKAQYKFHGEIMRRIPVNGYIVLYIVDYKEMTVNIMGVFSELQDIDSKFTVIK